VRAGEALEVAGVEGRIGGHDDHDAAVGRRVAVFHAASASLDIAERVAAELATDGRAAMVRMPP
jgi:hypothetical protein